MASIYCRLFFLLLVPISMVRADQIEMQNGDRYFGAVVSMTPDTVILQSEVLGQLKLPRNKVSTISLGAATNASHLAISTNNPTQASAALARQSTANGTNALRQLGENTNLVEQIKKHFLGDAGPQANEKFDELLTGLMTGKLDMDGLRAEAKTAADQLRAMKKDMGGSADVTLDAYLGVLDNFLAQSAPPATVPATNSTAGKITIQ